MWRPDSGVAGVTSLCHISSRDMCKCAHSLTKSLFESVLPYDFYHIMLCC